MLQHCARLLLPGMIEYVATIAALADDPAIQETHLSAVDEVLKAFAAFFNYVPEASRV